MRGLPASWADGLDPAVRATAQTLAAGGSAGDPAVVASAAGLRYVSEGEPGIRRRAAGKGFVYVDEHGRRIGDRSTIARIHALVIPPAWRDVWICPRADGHVQATGRDARGRKQYRYHADWRQVRDATKYERMVPFARRLPAIRRRVAADLRRPGLPREKVLALVVRLLGVTALRVGNAEYARTNGSFGLTTLRARHVAVSSTRVRFRFRGKAGKLHEIDVTDRRLAALVRKCQELPGQELFQYVAEDGSLGSIGSAEVNDYLREVSGADFSAKDFRTWTGTVAAARALADVPPPTSDGAARRAVADAIKIVAEQLGNTTAVCRKCYVHPLVVDAFMRGDTLRAPSGRSRGFVADERGVIALLTRATAAPAANRKAS